MFLDNRRPGRGCLKSEFTHLVTVFKFLNIFHIHVQPSHPEGKYAIDFVWQGFAACFMDTRWNFLTLRSYFKNKMDNCLRLSAVNRLKPQDNVTRYKVTVLSKMHASCVSNLAAIVARTS